MLIVPASERDEPAVARLLADAAAALLENNIFQWDEQYPNLDMVRSDLQKGCLFVGYDASTLWGAVSINEEQEAAYSAISWDGQGNALCIHRLTVHPEWQGQGLGKKLLDFALAYAQGRGYTSIRLDAYSGNAAALGLYERSGFARRGEVYFPRRPLPFVCFEKLLPQPERS